MKSVRPGVEADSLAVARPELLERREAGPSDADLLRAVAGGSEPAFAELRRRYGGAVESICRARLRRGAEEDCSQEVFARVWSNLRPWD